MSADGLIRALVTGAGILLLVGAVVVYVFALLPADAPTDANKILTAAGLGGFVLMMIGWQGDSR